VLADDHAFVRRSLRTLLESDETLNVVDEASDIAMVMRHVQSHLPHVLVLDISMPGGSILTALRELRALAPGTAIVVTTMLDDPGFAREAIGAGASAYVLKDAAARDLPEAIRAATRGESFIAPELTPLLAAYGDSADGLSKRELDVLNLIALGHTNTETAARLQLSVRTVESHRAHIHRKLGLATRAELVRYALRRGLLAPPTPENGTDLTSGSSALTAVPSSEDSIVSLPPATSTRSRMPVSPNPPVWRSTAKPRPSSATNTASLPASPRTVTVTCPARACLATFVSASWTTR
jgi:two-component system response regulator NreC